MNERRSTCFILHLPVRMILSALAGILFLVMGLPLPGISQTDTLVINNKLELEEVVISGQRSPVVYSRLSRIVGSITEEELDAMPVSALDDALRHVSGIDIRQRGAMGIQGDLSIRGSSFDQNMILLNGIDVTDPQTGHFALNLPVDITDVREIEVLKGPGSRIFGPNSFGGAVNIITKPVDSSYAKLSLTGGSHWYSNATVSGNVAFSGMKHYVSFSRSESRGYVENTDFLTYNLFYHGLIDVDQNRLEIQMGHKDKAYGAQSFYTPEYPHQFENTTTTLASIGMDIKGDVLFEPVVYWRRHRDRFELFREDDAWYQRTNEYFVRETGDTAKYQSGIYQPWNYYSGHNYHLTDIYGTKLNASFHTLAGETSLGFDFRSENIWSNVLGEDMGDTIKAPGESNGLYDKRYSRTLMNYYLEHNIHMNGISLSGGILGSWSNEFNLGWKFYPGIDVSYQFLRSFKVYASYNKSLRLPTFTDLFYSGPSNIGNPDLKPERVKSYEGGIKMESRAFRGHVSYFHYDAENIIAWTRENNEDNQWQTMNLTEVINRGVEFSLSADPEKIFEAIVPLKKIGIDYTYIDQDKLTDGFESKYSLNYLNHNLGVYMKGGWKRWMVSFTSSYTDRAGKYLRYNFEEQRYTNEVEYKPAWVFDGKISYIRNNWKFFMETTNIFDNKHYDIGNVRTPGRWIKLGMEKRFGL